MMKTLAAGGEGTLTEPLKVARDRLLEGLHSDRDKPDHTFLLYAQDGKGMGHIARSLTIAGHLLEAYPNSTAYVVTESPVTDELPLPKGCTVDKLRTHLASGALPKTEQDDGAFVQHLSDELARIVRRVALDFVTDF